MGDVKDERLFQVVGVGRGTPQAEDAALWEACRGGRLLGEGSSQGKRGRGPESAELWDGRGHRAQVLLRNPDTRLRASGEPRALVWPEFGG